MKDKICLIWQGVDGRYGYWTDGLNAAMKILEKSYDISYIEPDADLEPYDLLIYWEAPCTINGPNRDKYLNVFNSHKPKILLFAGGPVVRGQFENFNAIAVESKINVQEFKELGTDVFTAFGINTEIFKPIEVKKEFKVVHHGTCASWKRQNLLAEAFGQDALLVGRFQESDPSMFTESKRLGATVLDELTGDDLSKAIQKARVLVQSSAFWGGGQRCTLEAMASGLPVIVMSDSPKNIEYIEESGAGVVCEPTPEAIRVAYEQIEANYEEFSKKGIAYVKSKWTEKHYAESLRKIINLFLTQHEDISNNTEYKNSGAGAGKRKPAKTVTKRVRVADRNKRIRKARPKSSVQQNDKKS